MTSFPAHFRPDVLANGLLLVDKPPHWEVGEVVAAVQRATRAAKVASVVPLDAAASGLMLLCFGAATRLSAAVERSVKRYEGSLMLGAAAAAGDVRGGSLVAEALPWRHVTDEELQEAANALLLTLGSSSSSGGGGGGNAGGSQDDVEDGTGASDGDAGDRYGGGGDASSRTFASASASASSCSRGGGPVGGVLQVLPPRFRLRQYPSSFAYYEDDAGPSVQTIPIRLHEFKAWRASEEEILRAAAVAAAGAKTPAAAAAVRAGFTDPQAAALEKDTEDSKASAAAAATAGGVAAVAATMAGRVIRFSLSLTGRAHVRALVEMYGRRLRTCAALDDLRRTGVASFDVGDAWPLEAVLPILQRYRR